MSARFHYGNIRLRFEHWPVIWLWPISIVLMQVTLAEIGDFSVTVAVIVCHLLQLHLVMFYWLRRPPDWQTTMALVILAYGAVAGAFARDPWEFLRSFAHVTNLMLTVGICLNVRIGRGEEVTRSLALFCMLAAAVAVLVIAQAISFNVLRDFRLAPCWGTSRLLGPAARSTPRRSMPRCRAPTACTRSRRSQAGS